MVVYLVCGLFDDADAIALYMSAGPDCVRMIEEFESIHTKRPTVYKLNFRRMFYLS